MVRRLAMGPVLLSGLPLVILLAKPLIAFLDRILFAIHLTSSVWVHHEIMESGK